MWFIVKITVNLNEGAYFCIDHALYIAGYVFSTHILKKVNCGVVELPWVRILISQKKAYILQIYNTIFLTCH